VSCEVVMPRHKQVGFHLLDPFHQLVSVGPTLLLSRRLGRMFERQLLVNDPFLGFAQNLRHDGVPCHLSGKFRVDRAGEDVAVGALNQFFNDLEGARVARDMQRSPVLGAAWLLEVERLHVLVLQCLVDGEHPFDRAAAVTFRGNVHMTPVGLFESCNIGARENQLFTDGLESDLNRHVPEVCLFEFGGKLGLGRERQRRFGCLSSQ